MNGAPLSKPRGKLRRWWGIWVAGGVDHDEVVRQIAEDSGWSGRYAFLIVISAALSLLGLLMPSVAVLIGAMLLSPLMMPIIGLGFGIATLDFHKMRRAAIALAAGAGIAILLSIIFVSISPIQTITSEIAGRTRPTMFDLLVALLSAVAGAYALIRGRGGAVVGVAIAIALMPPLVVVGFGIATSNWTVFSGALLLFLTNAVTIALTAALVARVYGFGSHLSPRHTGGQLILFVVGLGLLSIPLAAALRQIAFEAVAQRQVRETIRDRFPDGARISQLDIDYGATPIRIRAVVVTPRLDANADAALAESLKQRLSRPTDVHVDQVRISVEAGEGEAAQISRAGESAAALRSTHQTTANNLALLAGVDPSEVRFNQTQREVSVTAAPLPGLGVAGYHALENRAALAIPGWLVRLAPPEGAELPKIEIVDGILDGTALDLAAWGSERLGAGISVLGGTPAQRKALADGIIARGGQATVGASGGSLRLAWSRRAEPDAKSKATVTGDQ